MSLVNDALKRAKEAHDRQAGQPLRGAPLHTVAPPPASKMWIVALLCFVFALVGAGGGIWYWKKHRSLSPANTEAAATPAYKIIMGANPTPTAAKPAPAAPVTRPAPVTAKTTAVEPVMPPPATPPAPPAAAPAPKPESASGAIVVDNRRVNLIPPAPAVAAPNIPPPSPPVPLRLQGILYSATKPAAILNGRTVWVGDIISGITISAIEPDRITIIYSNQPIVIRMP